MKLPRASTVVASVFGIGYFDVAPGTIMSAIAVPLAILIAIFGGGGMGVLASSLIAFVIGVLACADHVRETKREDPSECVIDELAGQWLACSFCLLTFGGLLPPAHISLPLFALAFALFRLFDIWKPWPVSWADQQNQRAVLALLDRRYGCRPDGGRAGGGGPLISAPVMFSKDLLDRAENLLATARAGGVRIATAESCTGGLIAALLTEIPGSSDVFGRGFVTYSNQAKEDMLGVPAATLRQHGAVSEPVARIMAEGAIRNSTAQLSVAVTAARIAGPGGGTGRKAGWLGVHIAVARAGEPTLHREYRFGDIGRGEIRLASVAAALEMLQSLV